MLTRAASVAAGNTLAGAYGGTKLGGS